ncbi:hypothetical protein GCM10022197_17660 [Microlunatus spumicola]|uniref:Uncharacterized protein n=1 Tax=Microlunatus spumicola TaxID=81499 RepID=A0ABP6XCK3_9ACTN
MPIRLVISGKAVHKPGYVRIPHREADSGLPVTAYNHADHVMYLFGKSDQEARAKQFESENPGSKYDPKRHNQTGYLEHRVRIDHAPHIPFDELSSAES